LNLTHYNEGQHLIKPRLAYLPLVCLVTLRLNIAASLFSLGHFWVLCSTFSTFMEFFYSRICSCTFWYCITAGNV